MNSFIDRFKVFLADLPSCFMRHTFYFEKTQAGYYEFSWLKEPFKTIPMPENMSRPPMQTTLRLGDEEKKDYAMFSEELIDYVQGHAKGALLAKTQFILTEDLIEAIIALEPSPTEYARFYEGMVKFYRGVGEVNMLHMIYCAPTQSHVLETLRKGHGYATQKQPYPVVELIPALYMRSIGNEPFLDAFRDYLKNSDIHYPRHIVISMIEHLCEFRQQALDSWFGENIVSLTRVADMNTFPCASLTLNAWAIRQCDLASLNYAIAEGLKLEAYLEPYLEKLGLKALDCKKVGEETIRIWVESSSEALPDMNRLNTVVEAMIQTWHTQARGEVVDLDSVIKKAIDYCNLKLSLSDKDTDFKKRKI